MEKLNYFVIGSVASNISKMNNRELQKLAEMLVGSVGEKFSDYLAFAIQDEQIRKNEITEMETIW